MLFDSYIPRKQIQPLSKIHWTIFIVSKYFRYFTFEDNALENLEKLVKQNMAVFSLLARLMAFFMNILSHL